MGEPATAAVVKKRPAAWTGHVRGATKPGTGRSRLGAAIAGLTLILAACGGQAAPPASSPVTAVAPTPSATASATATPAATPSPPASAVAGACTSDAPTSTSQTWTQLTALDGGYRFSRPGDWTDLSSTITIPVGSSVSPQTFAQTGLKTDAPIKVDIVRSPDTLTVISAWAIKGVTSETSRLFTDELAWLKTQPQLKAVLDDSPQACIDGTPARGFVSAWTSPNGDKTVYIYVAQRDGTMYEIQMTTDDPALASTLEEVFRTWKWTSAAASGGPSDVTAQLAATKFAAFGTASELDQSGDHPNPATFKTAFPAKSDKIYVIYELDDGVADSVEFTWRLNGVQIFNKSYNYAANTAFGWAGITSDPSTGLFRTGRYEISATLKKAGDTISTVFTVE